MSDTKQIILETIDDLAQDFLYFDRKEDEELGVGDLSDAIESGVITIDEIVAAFRRAIHSGLPEQPEEIKE